MNEMQILQSIILALAGWNLLQTHKISVRLARLEQAFVDLWSCKPKNPPGKI